MIMFSAPTRFPSFLFFLFFSLFLFIIFSSSLPKAKTPLNPPFQMHTRSLLKVLVHVLCSIVVMMSMTATVLALPQSSASDLLTFEEPHQGAVYKVGDEVHVSVPFKEKTENPLYKDNTRIDLFIQKRILMTALDKPLGSINAQELYANGFKFTILESYVIATQSSVPFRLRAQFDGSPSGFADSGGFNIQKQ